MTTQEFTITYPELNDLSHVWELEGEIWKDIVGHEGLYQVSCYGRVRRLEYESIGRNQTTEYKRVLPKLMLKANNDSRGYPQVTISSPRRVARVHRLVAEAFLEPPTQEVIDECKNAGLLYVQVNHKDTNRENPNLNNLEWCSPKYNLDYSSENHKKGRKKISGSNNTCSILKEDDIVEIIKLLKEGVLSQEKIAEQFGVKQITISNIWTGRSWSHFTGIPWTARSRKKTSDRKPQAVSC